MTRPTLLYPLTILLLAACSDDSGAPADGAVAADRGPDQAADDIGKPDKMAADLPAPDAAKPDSKTVPDLPPPDQAMTPDKGSKADAGIPGCPALKKAVTDEIARIAKCTATSECTYLWGFCPFGCHIPHNKSADLTKYKAAIAAYQASSLCQKCTYKCGPAGSLKCTGGKCVMSYP